MSPPRTCALSYLEQLTRHERSSATTRHTSVVKMCQNAMRSCAEMSLPRSCFQLERSRRARLPHASQRSNVPSGLHFRLWSVVLVPATSVPCGGPFREGRPRATRMVEVEAPRPRSLFQSCHLTIYVRSRPSPRWAGKCVPSLLCAFTHNARDLHS